MHIVTLRNAHSTIVAVIKPLKITYSEQEFVALVIQHVTRMHRVFVRGLSYYTVFFHIPHKRYDFKKIHCLTQNGF